MKKGFGYIWSGSYDIAELTSFVIICQTRWDQTFLVISDLTGHLTSVSTHVHD